MDIIISINKEYADEINSFIKEVNLTGIDRDSLRDSFAWSIFQDFWMSAYTDAVELEKYKKEIARNKDHDIGMILSGLVGVCFITVIIMMIAAIVF